MLALPLLLLSASAASAVTINIPDSEPEFYHFGWPAANPTYFLGAESAEQRQKIKLYDLTQPYYGRTVWGTVNGFIEGFDSRFRLMELKNEHMPSDFCLDATGAVKAGAVPYLWKCRDIDYMAGSENPFPQQWKYENNHVQVTFTDLCLEVTEDSDQLIYDPKTYAVKLAKCDDKNEKQSFKRIIAQ